MAVIEETGYGASTRGYSISTGTVSYEVRRATAPTPIPHERNFRDIRPRANRASLSPQIPELVSTQVSPQVNSGTGIVPPAPDFMDDLAKQYQQTGTVDPIQFGRAVWYEANTNPALLPAKRAGFQYLTWGVAEQLAVRAGNFLGGGYLPHPTDPWTASFIAKRASILGELGSRANLAGALLTVAQLGGDTPRISSPARALDPDLAASFMRNKISYSEARKIQDERNMQSGANYILIQTKEQQLIDYASRQATILLGQNRMSREQQDVHNKVLRRMGFWR